MSEIVMGMGRTQIELTRDDPQSGTVAAMAEEMFGKMLETGAEHHTVVVLLAAMVGYSFGNGARMAGLGIDEVKEAIAYTSSTLIFAAHDAFANGIRETVQ